MPLLFSDGHELGKDVGMCISWRKLFLVCFLLIFIGCVSDKPSRWGHFHGDQASRGFQMIDSGFALSSSWTSMPYNITSSSPVIGKDLQGRDVVYIGTADSSLVAIKAEDGTEKWNRALGSGTSGSRIISSPSVSDKGDIYVISSRKTGYGRAQSTLHKIDQFGVPKWAYVFPDNGFTAGSPKVFVAQSGILIFVYLSVVKTDSIQGELFVLRDDGYLASLLDRKALATCSYDVSGGKQPLEDLFNYSENTWNMVGDLSIEHDRSRFFLPNRFIDPTVAVITDREKPLIAIADNLCSTGAFEWDGSELTVLWRQEHSYEKHSSAGVSANGLMVFGRWDGKVLAHDVTTGIKMWEYDAGQAVFATPSVLPEEFVFVVSKDHLHVLKAVDGTLIHDEEIPRKLRLLGTTYSSPAVTANRVYVSSFEMLTVTHDLKTRGHDSNFNGNGLSSVAIGSDGAVYAVAADGTIRKYAGTD